MIGNRKKNPFAELPRTRARLILFSLFVMLGFSMKGKMIPVASNDNPKDNLLFTAYGTAVKNVSDVSVELETVLAGKGGAKISTVNVPYIWSN